MKLGPNDPPSTQIQDRRSEKGLKGTALHLGRKAKEAVKRGGPLGGLVRNALPKPKPDPNSPLPVPTMESTKKWPSLEETYANDDIYGFGTPDEGNAAHTNAIKEVFNPASLGTGKLTKIPAK